MSAARCVFCDEAALDGHLTCGQLPCNESLARDLRLRVGDIVVVGRPCMGNPAGTRAVAVEEYDLGEGPAWSLLFPNGNHDGFPLRDLIAFAVRRDGHDPTLADYKFTSAIRLYQHWQSGLFHRVWS